MRKRSKWKMPICSIYRKELKQRATRGEKILIRMFNQYKIKYIFQKGWMSGLDTFIISDFYIPKIKTVIEVDGASHNTLKQKEKDKLKDEYYKKRKFDVVRVNL